MIDRTSDFLKALKQCRKNLAKETGSLILKPKVLKPTTSFGKNSHDIVSSITKFRDFLLDNQKLYLGNMIELTQMSDQERLQFDTESKNCIKTCSEALNLLKQTEMPVNAVSQANLHKKHTIDMIEKYLKNVCQIYSRQQAVHVKKVVDKKRISRLQSETPRKQPIEKQTDASQDQIKPPNIPQNYLFDSSDDELSPEDEASFQQENLQLLNDMNSLVDEVKAIEGKVVEIARLQEMFSEQVFKQEDEIDVVAETIIESSENVKDGNEELREAIKNNAGFRVWILFFLVTCSFSLLFLEWYS